MKTSVVMLTVILAVLAGCTPALVGAPCATDQNCPSDQYCSADHTCQLGDGDGGSGGGSASGGGHATGGGTGVGGGTTAGGGTATGGGTSTGGGTTTSGDYTVTVTPPSGLNRSGSADVTFTLTRTAPFTGAVTLTLKNPPTGVSPSPVTNTSGTTATMTLVTNAAACGALPLQVTASASGLADKTIDLPASVTLPNDLTLALAGSSVNVLRGGSVSAHGTLTRAACAPADPAQASVTGLPSGVTASVTNGDAPVFTFSASTGATLGKTTVQVKVTVGSTVSTQPVDLYVVQAISGMVVGSLGFPAYARVEVAGCRGPASPPPPTAPSR